MLYQPEDVGRILDKKEECAKQGCLRVNDSGGTNPERAVGEPVKWRSIILSMQSRLFIPIFISETLSPQV